MDRRSPSPDDLNKRLQKPTEKPSSDAPSSSRLQELRNSYRIGSGQSPRERSDQQVGTNEASPSGLGRQSTRQKESDDKLHLQADSHYARREYEKAKPLYKDLLPIYKEKFGENDLKTALVENGLANVYKKQGKPEKAKPLYERVLPIYKEKFRENDPKTEKVRRNLADLAEKLGQPLEGYVGQKLGDYCLKKPLGHGGFATVYLGEHAHLSMQAAVKVLHQTHLVDQKAKEEFLKEAQTLADLKHPHIVRILSFGVKGEVPFLVMEYALHGTLRQAHPRGACLSPTDVTEYVNKIASALQYVHNNGKMHLDLKPDNVLLGAKREILLSDFGLAQDVHHTTSQPIQEKATVQYAAPEQLYSGKPRPASDQYALGVMVYEWLSGNRPFYVASHPDLNVRPEPLHGRIEGISRQMERVVFKALKPKPEDRYSSVKEFAEAFEQACRKWEQERVTPTDRVPLGEGSSSQPDGGERSAERSRLPRFGKWDQVLREEGSSSPSTEREGTNRHAEQQLLDRSRNLRQQVDQLEQDNKKMDKTVQDANSNVQETRDDRKERKGLARQLWELIRQGGGSAEKQEVREQEQVAPTDRVPREEGSSSWPAGGERANRYAEQQLLDHVDRQADVSRNIRAKDLARMSPSEQVECCIKALRLNKEVLGLYNNSPLIPAIKNILRNQQIDMNMRCKILDEVFKKHALYRFRDEILPIITDRNVDKSLRKNILYNIGSSLLVERFEDGIRKIVRDNEEDLDMRKAALDLDTKWDAFTPGMRSFHDDFRQSAGQSADSRTIPPFIGWDI